MPSVASLPSVRMRACQEACLGPHPHLAAKEQCHQTGTCPRRHAGEAPGSARAQPQSAFCPTLHPALPTHVVYAVRLCQEVAGKVLIWTPQQLRPGRPTESSGSDGSAMGTSQGGRFLGVLCCHVHGADIGGRPAPLGAVGGCRLSRSFLLRRSCIVPHTGLTGGRHSNCIHKCLARIFFLWAEN